MSGRILALSTAALLAWATVATAAPPGALDLIPEDAAAGLAIRNLDDLIKKGDKFVDDGGFGKDMRPSQLFTLFYTSQGISDAVDQNAGAAILVANPEILGVELFKNNGPDFDVLLRLSVAVVPFTDADKIGACFEIKKGSLQPGKVVKGKGKDFGTFFTVRDKHLIYGNEEKVVAAVAKAKPVGSALTADRRKALNEADAVLHLNPQALGDQWALFLKELEGQFVGAAGGDEQKVAHELVEGLAEARYVVFGLRVDDGLGVSVGIGFPKNKNEATKKLLTTLETGPGASDLNGLPEGRVVAAQATKGDGARNTAIVKVFFQGFAQTKLLLSASERTNFAGVFAEVWQRLKGSRFAVYHNADETKHGLFSVLAILDTDDPEQFLKEMRKLAHFADGESFDLSAKNPRKDDVAAVEQLIRDLGSDKYEVRESASTKLGIIGDAALPYLEKALKSDDAEVSRRAQALKTSIEDSAELRKKELLVKEAIPRVRPTFVFVPKAETADGHKIDVVGVKVADKEFAAVKQFTELFGPEWNKIRLAVQGKQVVVLLGSDQELLKAALKNVKDGKKGLGEAKHLAAFAKQADPARKVEFHAALQALTVETEAEWKALKQADAKPSLTSFALTVDAERLQLDVWIPIAEAKVIAKKAGVP